MPEPRDPPPTDEGWYALHDFRTIDWDAWRDTPQHERERILDEATDHFESTMAVEDAEDGATAIYSMLGHKADFLVLHLRPSTAHIGALERGFENTAFAEYTERETSFVSVTEASGYSERARDYFEGDLDENSGLANYIRTRLYPTIPETTHVCFYPMDKRRQPEQNWYELSFEERAEHMEAHGDIGREYGGRVVQMITGAIAIDDWEWGVTLWGDDLTDLKDLLYEMRFDPSTSQFAEFGSFYVGRRITPTDLPALLAGEPVPVDEDDETTDSEDPESVPTHPEDATGEHEAEEDEESSGGKPPMAETDATWTDVDDMETRLGQVGIHAGEDFERDGYALVLYSDADAQELSDEVDGLRGNFEHYDSHIRTRVRAEGGRSAIVSVWDAERAADTAFGFLQDLPGVGESYGGPVEGGDTDTESSHTAEESADIRETLDDLDVYGGQPHGEDIFALVLYSDADLETLEDEVAELSDGFDRYDTHRGTTVYDDPDSETAAVVSHWDTADAAETASDYLADLPGEIGWADEGDGFETMGMFYTVKPEYREEFADTFEEVHGLLEEMDGHRDTALLANTTDENDMFIASRWDSKEDAMGFFKSDAFAETLDWGREVLADQPRHVFLA
ncbi:chlorite dismutase [Halovenus aranensis]|uniref:Chlorite dismutase n=1 Tax=Halovenus aranensis TaxID=890420 RepID=A0A1G8TNP9_9EURY|nr:heme-binding protein [Halovenus aranensis]SDJ43162.1 chlorite dismutase [Halovenus aranensis]